MDAGIEDPEKKKKKEEKVSLLSPIDYSLRFLSSFYRRKLLISGKREGIEEAKSVGESC